MFSNFPQNSQLSLQRSSPKMSWVQWPQLPALYTPPYSDRMLLLGSASAGCITENKQKIKKKCRLNIPSINFSSPAKFGELHLMVHVTKNTIWWVQLFSPVWIRIYMSLTGLFFQLIPITRNLYLQASKSWGGGRMVHTWLFHGQRTMARNTTIKHTAWSERVPVPLLAPLGMQQWSVVNWQLWCLGPKGPYTKGPLLGPCAVHLLLVGILTAAWLCHLDGGRFGHQYIHHCVHCQWLLAIHTCVYWHDAYDCWWDFKPY